METKEITIYVQTRGYKQEFDYCWQEIAEDGQKRSQPPMVKEISALIDTAKPSVVIVRPDEDRDKILLLVTEFETTRSDVKRRPIRNDVVLVCKKEDEAILRAIAVQALREGERKILTRNIDNAVTSDDICGFKVDWNKFQNIFSEVKFLNQALNQGNQKDDISKFTPDIQEKLATELESYSLFNLPKDQKWVVIATEGYKPTKKILQEVKVWRGYSNYIEDSSTQSVQTGKQRISILNIIFSSLNWKKFKNPVKIVLATLLIISVIINIFLIWQLNIKNEIKNIDNQVLPRLDKQSKLLEDEELHSSEMLEEIHQKQIINQNEKRESLNLRHSLNSKLLFKVSDAT